MDAATWVLIGVFAGAWLQYRAGRGSSPIPSLPARKPKPEPRKVTPLSGE